MYPFGKNQMGGQPNKEDDLLPLHEFTVPVSMTPQEIAPPLYVWDRIANILDEQDRKKMLIKQTEAIAFGRKRSSRKVLLFSIGVLAVAGMLWYFS